MTDTFTLDRGPTQLAVNAQSKVKQQRHTGKQRVHSRYLSQIGAVNLPVNLEQSHQ